MKRNYIVNTILRKKISYVVLIFTLALQGCAFQSVLFDVEEPRAGFVITRPPVQISYRGDVSPQSQAFALNVLKQLQTEKANGYKFNENTNVRLNSIDGKSDKININLHESTAKHYNDRDDDDNSKTGDEMGSE